jgi:putative ABC transport system substrate-binding protein
MDRRVFLMSLSGSLLAAPLAAEAQQKSQPPRIGYLGTSSPSLEPELVKAFQAGLREHGYIEGQNIVVEYRWAEGDYRRFPNLVADLLSLKVHLIVTSGTPGALAAKRATTTTPIVMAVTGDAVGAGLVTSLAQPGGNLTGLTTMVPDLEGKRLEFLRQILPQLSTIAVLLNTDNPYVVITWKVTQASAQALGLTLQPVELRGDQDFAAAFAKIAQQRPNALTLIADRFLLAHRTQIVEFAAKERLPAMYPYKDFVLSGGLISYSPSYEDLFRRSAVYVDKILKGAKPGDLPVEQPTKFELVINMKTVKGLGLTIPPSLLLRADEIIQ